MIIGSYLIREVVRPFLIVATVLLLIMVSYSAVEYLSDPASSLLGSHVVVRLIFAKTIVAFELFLPLAFFITLLIGLGKLYEDQEITAIGAAGVSVFGIVKLLLPLILIVTILTSLLSIYVRPWAYAIRYDSTHRAEQAHDFDRLESGHFYENEDEERVYFVNDVQPMSGIKQGVFVREEAIDFLRVIFSKQAEQISEANQNNTQLFFRDGTAYRFGKNETDDLILEFEELRIIPEIEEADPRGFKRKAASTDHLLQSKNIKEIAELQKRLSAGVNALLLALVAVFFAKTQPRQGRYGKLVLGVFFFFSVYGFTLILKSALEQGQVPIYPGMWWVPIFVLMVLVLVMRKEA